MHKIRDQTTNQAVQYLKNKNKKIQRKQRRGTNQSSKRKQFPRVEICEYSTESSHAVNEKSLSSVC